MLGAITVIIVAAALVLAAMAWGDSTRAGADGGRDMRQQIDDIAFSGNGSSVSEKFALEAGVMILHMTYSGPSYLIVNLYNETGYLRGMLANEKGPFEGSTLIGVQNGSAAGAVPGKYFMEVEATGAWNITIEQPRVNSGAALPDTVSGRGADVSGPMRLENGSVTFNITHVGSSSFAVKLWADDGTYVELLASELGNFTGERVVRVGDESGSTSPGLHWLSVDADGEWVIAVTES